MGKRHIRVDETLGLEREYTVAYDRKAKQGEWIVPITVRPPYYVVGDYGRVEHTFRHEVSAKFDSNYEGVPWTIPHANYGVLEPTKYVIIEGVTYRLADRKAEVGESIVAKDKEWMSKKLHGDWRKKSNSSPVAKVLSKLPRSCVVNKFGTLLTDDSYYVLVQILTEEAQPEDAKPITRCFMCEKELFEGDTVRIYNITTFCSATCVADGLTYTEVLTDK